MQWNAGAEPHLAATRAWWYPRPEAAEECAISNRISRKQWNKIYDKTVDNKFAETHWPVYGEYELGGIEGIRHVWAPVTAVKHHIDPLSPKYADLFLTFARWFDTQKMERVQLGAHGVPTLDTERNAEAALSWVRRYGVLGLGRNSHESFGVGGNLASSSGELAAARLGKPALGYRGTRAYSKGRRGGPHETVEMFVLEACEASVVLKLYEAATAPKLDAANITRFMLDRTDAAYLRKGDRKDVKTEREFWSQDDDLVRSWALTVVEETVTRKVEQDVYHVLLGEPNRYERGWGIKSLLGAMWLQMDSFMLGENDRCPECGLLFYKSRRDKTFCSNRCAGRARARRNYHEGAGASSKQARRAKRYRQEG